MEEDDDWLNDTSGPNQGGATDPLTNVEYDRIASRYSDVSLLLFALNVHSDDRPGTGKESRMGN